MGPGSWSSGGCRSVRRFVDLSFASRRGWSLRGRSVTKLHRRAGGVLSYSHRATSRQKPAHHARLLQLFGLVEDCRTPVPGQGATVFSPGTGSRAGARVVNVFTATSVKATVLPAGCAGANRRRSDRCFSEATVLPGTACPTVLSACPLCTATPSVESAVHRRHPGTPSRSRTTRCAVRPSLQWMACAGPAAVRTASAGPVAVNCPSMNLPSRAA